MSIQTHPERLSIPLKRRKPTVYAVWNDGVHEAVTANFIGEMFEVINKCPQHTFLLLTKRPQRAVAAWQWLGESDDAPPLDNFPFENVYTGLTVCNQQEADEKIPIFLQVPGKKFLSIEPMLAEMDLSRWLLHKGHGPLGGGCLKDECAPGCYHGKIDAVILGGESGPGARPMQLDWVRSVRDQCAAAGVPFFFKQWGEWAPVTYHSMAGCEHPSLPTYETDKFEVFALKEDRFNREYKMAKVGRKAAGRLLDGWTHDELPWREA